MKRNPHTFPGWALYLLERLVPYRNRDVVVGDFAEIFDYIASEEGPFRALRWYSWQLMRSLPSFFLNGFALGGSMVGNYMKVAVRNLSKRKFYAALNIGGLAIGMAVCLLILQYVAFETSYDSFHENSDQLYRVNMSTLQASENLGTDALTFHAVAPAIQESIPELENVTRFHPSYGSGMVRVVTEDGPLPGFRESTFGYADPSFLDMFSFESVAGDARAALASSGKVSISERAAARYFHDVDPVGQIIDIRAWINGEFEVGAVIKNVPGNSHLQFDILIPLNDLLTNENAQYAETDGWSWSNFITYVQLKTGTDPESTAKKIDAVIMGIKSDDWASNERSVRSELQPIESIHLYNDFDDQFSASAAYKTVFFLSLIGLFVLVIAWVNYVNLTTARAMERAREVGIRKAAGARRSQVVWQFLLESILVNFIALTLAVLASIYALPYLNQIVGVEIPSSIWRSQWIWISLLSVFGLGAVVASLYPAFILSAYQPVTVLKGLFGTAASGTGLRKLLVVFQFTMSIALVSGMYIVYGQVQHLKGFDLGFNLDQVLVVRQPGVIDDADVYRSNREVFKTKVLEIPEVPSVATSNTIPGGGFNMGTTGRRISVAAADAVPLHATWINEDFVETYGFELIGGRNLSLDIESDYEDDAVLINESGALLFGFDSAEEAVDADIIIGGSNEAHIVGVLADFSWMSAKQEQEPILFGLTPGGSFFSMKVGTSNLDDTIARIETVYSELFPGNAFEYFFADSRFDDLYQAETRLGTLVGLFALFALLVAGLGLIGLAALTASQRVKEISIRKVLGASDTVIARLLTGNIALLVGVGLVLAVPIVYFIAENWLGDFAQRISLSPELFLIPGGVVLLMAVLASTYHVLRVATSNPVDGIRSE